MKRHFNNKDIQTANTNMKKMFIINYQGRKIQIKTITRYYKDSSEWLKLKTDINNIKFWQGYGETGWFTHCWWESKMVQSL